MKKYKITVNGTTYEVEVEEIGGEETVFSESISHTPSTTSEQPQPQAPKKEISSEPKPAAPKKTASAGSITIEAPMPGTILSIKVKPGSKVQEGDVIMILEAMKMENEILAPQAGKIATIEIDEGATVDTGDLLATME